ncbi:hypothetical protein AA0473_2577 [Acetobacter orleanensis NRIC 0473]|nr:hypothetical protein AA0473_2577 [Acetobacter orleanensis NRIC 0473]
MLTESLTEAHRDQYAFSVVVPGLYEQAGTGGLLRATPVAFEGLEGAVQCPCLCRNGLQIDFYVARAFGPLLFSNL